MASRTHARTAEQPQSHPLKHKKIALLGALPSLSVEREESAAAPASSPTMAQAGSSTTASSASTTAAPGAPAGLSDMSSSTRSTRLAPARLSVPAPAYYSTTASSSFTRVTPGAQESLWAMDPASSCRPALAPAHSSTTASSFSTTVAPGSSTANLVDENPVFSPETLWLHPLGNVALGIEKLEGAWPDLLGYNLDILENHRKWLDKCVDMKEKHWLRNDGLIVEGRLRPMGAKLPIRTQSQPPEMEQDQLGKGKWPPGVGQDQLPMGMGQDQLGKGKQTMGMGRDQQPMATGQDKLGKGKQAMGVGQDQQAMGMGRDQLGKGKQPMGVEQDQLGNCNQAPGVKQDQFGKERQCPRRQLQAIKGKQPLIIDEKMQGFRRVESIARKNPDVHKEVRQIPLARMKFGRYNPAEMHAAAAQPNPEVELEHLPEPAPKPEPEQNGTFL